MKSSHIRVLKSITLHQFSGELAAVVMCGTAVLCVQLSWYGLSHLTWQSQANVLTPWNETIHPQLMSVSCASLISTHNFMLVWNHKYAGLTWSLQRVQTIDCCVCLFTEAFYLSFALSLWSRTIESNQRQQNDVLDVLVGVCWTWHRVWRNCAFVVYSFEIHRERE